MSMPDPTPGPDENADDHGAGSVPGDHAAHPGEQSAQDSGAGPREEAGPEGLTVDDILSTPQSTDAESADAGQAPAEGEDSSAALAEDSLAPPPRNDSRWPTFAGGRAAGRKPSDCTPTAAPICSQFWDARPWRWSEASPLPLPSWPTSISAAFQTKTAPSG